MDLKSYSKPVGSLFYFAGGALWMAIMMKAAMSLPIIGFALTIPAGLVIYVVRQAFMPKKEDKSEELILN